MRWTRAGMAALGAGAMMAIAGVALGAQDDPIKKGEALYKAGKCATCHKIGTAGGKMGPDLSTVGTKRDEEWLKKYLPNPKSVNPKNVMPPVKLKEDELKALMTYLLSLKK